MMKVCVIFFNLTLPPPPKPRSRWQNLTSFIGGSLDLQNNEKKFISKKDQAKKNQKTALFCCIGVGVALAVACFALQIGLGVGLGFLTYYAALSLGATKAVSILTGTLVGLGVTVGIPRPRLR